MHAGRVRRLDGGLDDAGRWSSRRLATEPTTPVTGSTPPRTSPPTPPSRRQAEPARRAVRRPADRPDARRRPTGSRAAVAPADPAGPAARSRLRPPSDAAAAPTQAPARAASPRSTARAEAEGEVAPVHDRHRLPRPPRRDQEQQGPATWGWRGAVRRWSGGLVTPADGAGRAGLRAGPRARSSRTSTARARSPSSTPRAAPPRPPACSPPATPSAPSAAAAWSRGTTTRPAARSASAAPAAPTATPPASCSRTSSGSADVYQSRIGDLGAFVRSQGDAHFDVLASDERPDVTGHDPGRRTSTRCTSCSSASTG